MEEEKYEIFIDNRKVGELIGLNSALIFIRGLFNEYYNDTKMTVSLRRVREPIDEDEVWEQSCLK